MRYGSLHKAQAVVLQALRHTPSARFAVLQRAAAMESDVFKFHIRSLIKQGYIAKSDTGWYSLTTEGKTYANTLHSQQGTPCEQPKLSLLLVAERQTAAGHHYLMHTRKRQPYWGYTGFLSGPLPHGAAIETQACREFTKQTGYEARATVAGFLRQRDFIQDVGLAEDKLFAIVRMQITGGELGTAWTKGRSQWMTLAALRQQPAVFESTQRVISMLEAGETYASIDTTYTACDY